MHATTRRGWNDNAMESRFKPKDQESLHTHVRGIRMTEYGSMSVSRLLINCPALVQIYILSRTSLTHAKYITAMQYTVSASAMVAHFWPRCVNSSFLYWWPWFVSFVVCSRYSLFALPTSQHFHPDPHWLSLSLSLSPGWSWQQSVYMGCGGCWSWSRWHGHWRGRGRQRPVCTFR